MYGGSTVRLVTVAVNRNRSQVKRPCTGEGDCNHGKGSVSVRERRPVTRVDGAAKGFKSTVLRGDV